MIEQLLPLLFYFVIVNHPYEKLDWRESDPQVSLAACEEHKTWLRMNDEPGVFSECYAR